MLGEKVLEDASQHSHRKGFRRELLHELRRTHLQLVEERLRILEGEDLLGVFLNHGGQMGGDYRSRVHHGVAKTLRFVALMRFDPHGF